MGHKSKLKELRRRAGELAHKAVRAAEGPPISLRDGDARGYMLRDSYVCVDGRSPMVSPEGRCELPRMALVPLESYMALVDMAAKYVDSLREAGKTAKIDAALTGKSAIELTDRAAPVDAEIVESPDAR